MKAIWAAVALGLISAGCANESSDLSDVDENAAPHGQPTSNLNSPTAGPSSSGLSGGTAESAPSELDPNRGTKVQ